MKRFIQNILMIIWLCAITILSSGCVRFLGAANIGDAGSRPFISITNPYFYGTRGTIEGVIEYYNNPAMVFLLFLDLPFEFAIDVIVEGPKKIIYGVTRPWHYYKKKKQEHRRQLSTMLLMDVFKEGLAEKRRWRLFSSIDSINSCSFILSLPKLGFKSTKSLV